MTAPCETCNESVDRLDFDGTSPDGLLDGREEFGDPAVYEEVEDGLDEGRLPLREVIVREFAPVTAPPRMCVAWAVEHASVRPGFARVRPSARTTAGTCTSSRAGSTS